MEAIQEFNEACDNPKAKKRSQMTIAIASYFVIGIATVLVTRFASSLVF